MRDSSGAEPPENRGVTGPVEDRRRCVCLVSGAALTAVALFQLIMVAKSLTVIYLTRPFAEANVK
jgi:hypothetical protein